MSNHPFGPGPSQKSVSLPLPLPRHTAAADGKLTLSSTSTSSLTGAPWVRHGAGQLQLQPLPPTQPPVQPLTGREVLHFGAPPSTGSSSSSSSSSSLSLAPQDESAWSDMPPLEPDEPAPRRTERKSEERPAPVQRPALARARAVKREPVVKTEPVALPLSTTPAGTRAPKRKAEGAPIEGSQPPGPSLKSEGRSLPSSSRLAQAGDMPVSTASSSGGASWQERLGGLLDEGTGEDFAVSLPSDPAAWAEALAQVLPELTQALALTRPKFLDAAPTEAERHALDLAHHLGELLAQLPGPLAPVRAQAFKAQVQGALQRLGRAAALPPGTAFGVPALQRSAGAGEGEDQALRLQAEALALRLGGAAQALQAATRRVLLQASPREAAAASLDALGKAFGPLFVRDAEAVVQVMASFVEAPVHWDQPVGPGTFCVMGALADAAGNHRALAIALLQHGLARFTAADERLFAKANWFAAVAMALVGGTVEAAGEASAELLRRVSDACSEQGGRQLPPVAAALCLAGMVGDPAHPYFPRTHRVLLGLARLPLARVAALLGLLCRHQPQAANGLRAALCDERSRLPAAQAAHVALAFGLAQRTLGTAAVQALFPAAAQGNARYALCRQACRAALQPTDVLRLPLSTMRENLALLREALRLAPGGSVDFSACAGIRFGAGNEQGEHVGRSYRLAAYTELFEAGHAGSAFDHLMPVHRTVLMDLQCLLAPSAPAPTREAALQCARRFYGTLERCHASVGLGAGVPSADAREQAPWVLDGLEEMLLDLRRQDAALQAVAVPLVQREADRLRALLAPPA